MNALFLKDLAQKTRRGLRGCLERGSRSGGARYGYASVKGESGVLVVHPEEAAVVLRIFRQFVAGVSPKAYSRRCSTLTALQGQQGSWSPSTIHGSVGRGTGILNNELYIGRRSSAGSASSRTRTPANGSRGANAQWDDEGRTGAADSGRRPLAGRESAAGRDATLKGGIVRARRPLYLFSKLTTCGTCGGGFHFRRATCSGASITRPRHLPEHARHQPRRGRGPRAPGHAGAVIRPGGVRGVLRGVHRSSE